jgi:prephenate dehydratase
MRVGYLGPAGTFSQEALMSASAADDWEPVPLPTNHETVIAVHEGTVDRALAPIENSLEGAVNPTLDALAFETDDVVIVGELVHPIRHCLVARRPLELEAVRTVVSHPQATAQCARFIRTRLRGAVVVPAASTADAVRMVAEDDPGADGPAVALGNRLAADLYGCEILRAGIEDMAGNETRFVWIAPAGTSPGEHGPWKTSLVFWGVGAEAPGWLVRCLSEFAFRGVNLTRIESRPRKEGLGRYMFFLDLEGRESDGPVAGAIAGLRAQADTVRVLGSYPAAA